MEWRTEGEEVAKREGGKENGNGGFGLGVLLFRFCAAASAFYASRWLAVLWYRGGVVLHLPLGGVFASVLVGLGQAGRVAGCVLRAPVCVSIDDQCLRYPARCGSRL
jgi:hypothetical protein